jgi:hypothetical protein
MGWEARQLSKETAVVPHGSRFTFGEEQEFSVNLCDVPGDIVERWCV